LIPAQPPRAALRARMERANRAVTEGRYVHTIEGKKPGPNPGSGGSPGYRPGRKGARKRPR
ncbi:MAG TPA: hypothetical protein VFT74_02635, partial [Isosphaeraceae bacterium]|nr:hypothetical protein [Isosphaeraceae bacterium]